MPGGAERILRRRIKTVSNTKKITRAMELIAATRVARAQMRARAARPYSEQLTGVIENLAAGGASIDHPLLRQVENVQKVAFVICAGDRGLAGAYNSNVVRTAEREIQALRASGGEYRIVAVGRKVEAYFRFRGYHIDSSFGGFTDNPTYDDARQIAHRVRELFDANEVDQVELVYTEFVSLGTQRPVVRRFLPLEPTSVIAGDGSPGALAGFSFEPSAEGVLEDLLPRYVEARLLTALLDAAASEHANRQRAMKAATDNAEELITKLSRAMNRARQDAITTEIMEIVGGAEGLAASDDDDGDAFKDLFDQVS
ncbi:MAG: F0F1 ATP synthase subunit gamma [Acidimicrobiia bacterium]|nr:F0F1 ATP synthase subunit gamma [Acidimicrobiia bacterium]MDH5290025.1 F0F1 ATP synthase subunit gamma [Acidimicrobiia bacterium]